MTSKRVSVAVGNRRLLKLADFLEKLPPKRFDYSVVIADDWMGKKDFSCGTTACAIGWAAAMPEFQKLGLRPVVDDNGFHQVKFGKGRHRDSFDSARRFFGLEKPAEFAEHSEADYLFDPFYSGLGDDVSAKRVATHIRKFVKARQSR